MLHRLKLYMDFLSQSSRSLYIILKQSDTVFVRVPIDMIKGEHLTPEFGTKNPLQKVPCITEGEFKLAESVAILRYLYATGRIAQHFYRPEVKERALIDQYLEWQPTLRQGVGNYVQLDFMIPTLTGKETSERHLLTAKKEMEKVLDIVENIWLGSSKAVAGNTVNAADVFGVCEVQQTKLTSYDLSKKYPKIVEWIAYVRTKTLPDFDNAHKLIFKLSKHHKM